MREPKSALAGSVHFQEIHTYIDILAFSGSKIVTKKVEIEGVGPPWRDSQRNSAPGRGPQVPDGATATHLVTERCDLESLGVPGPASTPLGSWPKAKGGVGDHLVTIVSAGTK